jgi:hypothetical protein
MPRSQDAASVEEVLLHLRYAIDTAISYPTWPNINAACTIATSYPVALRSSTMRTRLGQARWEWLNQNGIYPIGGPVTPDITT